MNDFDRFGALFEWNPKCKTCVERILKGTCHRFFKQLSLGRFAFIHRTPGYVSASRRDGQRGRDLGGRFHDVHINPIKIDD